VSCRGRSGTSSIQGTRTRSGTFSTRYSTPSSRTIKEGRDHCIHHHLLNINSRLCSAAFSPSHATKCDRCILQCVAEMGGKGGCRVVFESIYRRYNGRTKYSAFVYKLCKFSEEYLSPQEKQKAAVFF
jgi:hypothetical protein